HQPDRTRRLGLARLSHQRVLAVWKLLFQSVRGTSHEQSGQPCQDACRARLVSSREGQVLLLACADGAGSAPRPALRPQTACRAVLDHVQADLVAGLAPSEVEIATVVSWVTRARGELMGLALSLEQPLSVLACTLLLAVVAERVAVFAQIGDGVMVTLD